MTEVIRPVGQDLTGCDELKLDLQAWTAERMIVTSVLPSLGSGNGVQVMAKSGKVSVLVILAL